MYPFTQYVPTTWYAEGILAVKWLQYTCGKEVLILTFSLSGIYQRDHVFSFLIFRFLYRSGLIQVIPTVRGGPLCYAVALFQTAG